MNTRVNTVLLLCLFAAIATSAQDHRTPLSRRAAPEIISKYLAISGLNVREQRAAYLLEPTDVRSDLWTLHLESFLAQHPDLTPEQRAVVFEAIGLLATGIMEIHRSDPGWDANVRLPLNTLTLHARAAFPHDELVTVFNRLARTGAVCGSKPNRFARHDTTLPWTWRADLNRRVRLQHAV